jgi:hypothetical protein
MQTYNMHTNIMDIINGYHYMDIINDNNNAFSSLKNERTGDCIWYFEVNKKFIKKIGMNDNKSYSILQLPISDSAKANNKIFEEWLSSDHDNGYTYIDTPWSHGYPGLHPKEKYDYRELSQNHILNDNDNAFVILKNAHTGDYIWYFELHYHFVKKISTNSNTSYYTKQIPARYLKMLENWVAGDQDDGYTYIRNR